MLLITCTNPACRAQLFLSPERLPVCGRCNHPISPETMKAAAQTASPRRAIHSFLQNLFRRQSRATNDHGPIGDLAALQKKADALIKRAWPENPIRMTVIDP